MSKLVSYLELEVKCDEPGCGWKQAVDPAAVADWHNHPCPRCGRGVVINDWEMRLLNLVLSAVGNAAPLSSLTESEKQKLLAHVEIDTAPLRRLGEEAKRDE